MTRTHTIEVPHWLFIFMMGLSGFMAFGGVAEVYGASEPTAVGIGLVGAGIAAYGMYTLYDDDGQHPTGVDS